MGDTGLNSLANMPKGPQQPLRAEGNSSWLEKCRERDRKKTEISLFRWNPLLYPLMVCPTMISSLLHKRAWRLVPRGGNQRACLRLRACTRLCVFVRDAGQQRVLCPSRLLQQEPCLAHPLTACLKQLLSHALQHQSLLQVALCSSGLWMI